MEAGGSGELTAVIGGRVGLLRAILRHELDQRGGKRAALLVPYIFDDGDDAAGYENAARLRIKRRSVEPVCCGRRNDCSGRLAREGHMLCNPFTEGDADVVSGFG